MRLQSTDISFKEIGYLTLLALLLTISSLFWTKDIAYDRATLKHLEFGWPMAFIIQNQERFDPPFPRAMLFAWGLSSNEELHPAVQVVWRNGLASFGVNFLGVLFAWYLCTLLLRRRW
jgi:hypothetical protein